MSEDPSSGYKRPPKSTQFKRGQSGNPRGRPRNKSNLKDDLEKLLNKRISIREDGETRRISRQEAVLLSLFSKAIHGDVRAANSIIAMVTKFDPPAPTSPEVEPISENDELIIEDFLRRRSRKAGASSS